MKTSTLLGTTAVALLLPLSAVAQDAVIDNGKVLLGINETGNLGVATSSGTRGLTFLPTDGDAIAPGCVCEGWGIADMDSGAFGKAGESFGYASVASSSMTVTGTGTAAISTGAAATSVVNMVDGSFDVLVTHAFSASASDYLYKVDVTAENQASSAIGNMVYRRAMDWDIPPTEFAEFVTIQGWPASALIASSDDGFVDGDPNVPLNTLASDAVKDGNFTDSGPADHGAAFDFAFGTVAPGESQDFTIYYGAAPSEADALIALGDVGAEVYSLGQPSTTDGPTLGTPNTFIFAFAGVGGTPISGSAAMVPINQFGDIAEVFIAQRRAQVSAKLTDAQFFNLLAAAGAGQAPADLSTKGTGSELASGLNFSFDAFGGRGTFDATSNRVGMDYHDAGAALSLSRQIGASTLGVSLGYGKLNGDFDGGAGTLDGKSRDVELFGRHDLASGVFMEGILTYAKLSYDQSRVGAMATYHADVDANAWGGLVRLGKSTGVRKSGNMTDQIGFYGELGTSKIAVDGYAEDNNGLTVDGFDVTNSYGGVGLRWSMARKTADRTLFSRVDAAVLAPFGDTDYSTLQTTVGGAQMTAASETYGDTTLRVNGSIGAMGDGNWMASVDYGALVSDSHVDYSIGAKLSISF